MANKTLNSRIIMKHDTSANWGLASSFIPLSGELILYTDLKKYKIGDGTTTVGNLDFASEATLAGLGITASATELNYTTGVTSAIQTQLDNKIANPDTKSADQYLKYNGTSWEAADVDALPSQTGHSGKYLTTDGSSASWATVTLPDDMTGATATTAGTHGLVPAPAAGNQNKFLKGDGTWGEPVVTNAYTGQITAVASTLAYTVTHNLNTKAVIVQVYDATDFDTVTVDVTRTSENVITIEFGEQPTVGKQFIVMVMSMNTTTTIPNAEDTEF